MRAGTPDDSTPARPLRVLNVEDSEDDSALLMRELRRAGYQIEHRRVETEDAMRVALGEQPWDLVVSDFSMPQFGGLAALQLLKQTDLDVPFILVSGTVSEEIAVSAMKAGASDFMSKGRLARFVPVVQRELREAEERRKRRAAEAEVERNRMEVERSERLLRLVLDSVPDVVTVVDASGKLLLWNGAADVLVGVGRTVQVPLAAWSQTFGLFQRDKQTPHPADELPLARALCGEEVDRQELFLRNTAVPKGAWLSVNARPLRDASGAIRGAVAVLRDVTTEKMAHEQLMISDRMASVGMLAAGVGHEINNPLAAVLANLEVAVDLLDTGGAAGAHADLHEILDEARQSANQVRSIVRDLRIFSRHDEDKGGAVDVHGILESSARMAWNEIRHRAKLIKAYGRIPHAEGNESRLGQVFLNLIVNAAQAIPEGNVNANQIRLSTSTDASGNVVVEVADTGSGIAPEALRMLFTPFFTTKPAGVGTGLGLAICQRIVSSLGGSITVESELGKGSVFRVRLPASQGAGPAARALPALAIASVRRGRILIVEDESNVAAVMRRILAPEHDVVVTSNGALAGIHAGERYDVILCDLMMPEMTGMELHGAIRDVAPHQVDSIVFLTGGAFTPVARTFLEEVPNERIEKPFDARQLRTFVNQRVNAGASRA